MNLKSITSYKSSGVVFLVQMFFNVLKNIIGAFLVKHLLWYNKKLICKLV